MKRDSNEDGQKHKNKMEYVRMKDDSNMNVQKHNEKICRVRMKDDKKLKCTETERENM
jgi:hypothetical protein